jgi:hypothetical protein
MFIPDPIFSIPDLGSRVKKIPDPNQRIDIFSSLKIVSKLSENDLGHIHPGSGFFSQPGSRIRIRTTGTDECNTYIFIC